MRWSGIQAMSTYLALLRGVNVGGHKQVAMTGPEVIRADGTEACIVYPIGQGRSRLTN
jgi:Protein of unknown function (DUF1697)